MAFPPGATARTEPTSEALAAMAGFPAWMRCAGADDALQAPGPVPGPPVGAPDRHRSSFDDQVAHLGDAFAWLVVAEPVSEDAAAREMARLEKGRNKLVGRDSAAGNVTALHRLDGRFRELARAAGTGLWNVHILVGAATDRDVRRVAATLAAAADLNGQPYLLVPRWEIADAGTTLAAADPPPAPTTYDTRPVPRPCSPFLATSELLAGIARPPARELPGIRLASPHTFDVTPEGAGNGGYRLGTVVDAAGAGAGPFPVSAETLNKHAFVCGATGSGKSQTVRWLLESLATAEQTAVPWLVIEPAKAEYARMAGRLGDRSDVLVLRPGRLAVAPASLNPLEPEPYPFPDSHRGADPLGHGRHFPIQSHIDLVRALFLAAFEAEEPFPQVLTLALTACYRNLGWDLVADRRRPATRPKYLLSDPDTPVRQRYPTLGELQETARRVVENIGYGKEVTADVRGFVDVRIGSLREGHAGRFFEGGHPLDVGKLLERNVVIELEDITNDQDKAFFIGTVLIRIVEHLRMRYGGAASPGLRHVTVVEEAHRLLKKTHAGPAAAAVELFASLLAEIRAYGEGILVVEQIPSKIVPDVLKNTALKVMHRLPAADDREAVGATMNLTGDQAELVVAFEAGKAAVTVDGMDRPVLVRMTSGVGRESSDGALSHPPLAGPRSALCGADCRQRPCTLGQMNDAARFAADEPLVVLWVEAVTAATCMGVDPPPAPARWTVERFHAAGHRTRCALAYAVERAVAARAPFLRGYVDPDDMSDRLVDVLESQLAGRAAKPADRRRYSIGAFRLADIRIALDRAVKAGQKDRHPDSDAWAARGIVLDADGAAGQLAQLLARPECAPGTDRGIVGDAVASGLHAAVLATTGRATSAAVETALRLACTGPHIGVLAGRLTRNFPTTGAEAGSR